MSITFLRASGVLALVLIAALLMAAALSAPVFEVNLPRGLDFTLQNSPTPQKYLIETMPGGVALLDYNNDGLLDIFLVSGPGGSNRLYHNLGNGKFADDTKEMGLEHSGWGQ
ncbi:MAG: VCBS repeat-containing protein, partial [Candidatus Sulfotelmatobacter sp.]